MKLGHNPDSLFSSQIYSNSLLFYSVFSIFDVNYIEFCRGRIRSGKILSRATLFALVGKEIEAWRSYESYAESVT